MPGFGASPTVQREFVKEKLWRIICATQHNIELLRCDEVYHGRIYPRDVVQSAIDRARSRTIFGTFDGNPNSSVISMDQIAFQVKNVRIDKEGIVRGDIDVFPHMGPGALLIGFLVDAEMELQFLMRGSGNVNPQTDIVLNWEIIGVNCSLPDNTGGNIDD